VKRREGHNAGVREGVRGGSLPKNMNNRRSWCVQAKGSERSNGREERHSRKGQHEGSE
jgi:hypothetical protein